MTAFPEHTKPQRSHKRPPTESVEAAKNKSPGKDVFARAFSHTKEVNVNQETSPLANKTEPSTSPLSTSKSPPSHKSNGEELERKKALKAELLARRKHNNLQVRLPITLKYADRCDNWSDGG